MAFAFRGRFAPRALPTSVAVETWRDTFGAVLHASPFQCCARRRGRWWLAAAARVSRRGVEGYPLSTAGTCFDLNAFRFLRHCQAVRQKSCRICIWDSTFCRDASREVPCMPLHSAASGPSHAKAAKMHSDQGASKKALPAVCPVCRDRTTCTPMAGMNEMTTKLMADTCALGRGPLMAAWVRASQVRRGVAKGWVAADSGG